MPQLQINQGPQDALLYDNTRSYFTNVGYVRTSNFQMELRDVPAVNNAALGSRVDFIIPKSADLLGPIDLIVDFAQADTPAGTADAGDAIGNYAAWVETLGYAMIDEMSFQIGSHTVETISGEQMNIMNELMKGDTQRQGKTIGKTGRSGITLDVNETTTMVAATTGAKAALGAWSVHTADTSRLITSGLKAYETSTGSGINKSLIIPLNFFFTKHPSQYFPLCAIAGCNDVRISIKFRPLNELMIVGRHNYATATTSTSAGAEAGAQVNHDAAGEALTDGYKSPVPKFAQGALKKCEIRCHYVHVTGPEATTLMNKEHVRLLKLWHHQPKTFKVVPTTGGANHKFELDLGFLHPVQELIITIRKAGIMSSSTEHSEIPNALDQGATLKNYFAYEGSGVDPNIESHLNKIKATSTASPLDATGSMVNTIKVKNFQLSLNGQERHPSLAGKGIDREYLMDRLMPMLHSNTSETFTTAGVTDAGYDASATFAHLGEMLDRKEIYVYPFALNPEGANPSGAVNFSKVSHAKLTIECDAIRGAAIGGSAGDPEDYVVDVYGVYFNWLQIKDGRALTSFQ